MPKTNKICMYFDKEELLQMVDKLELFLKSNTIDTEIEEIIYRTIQKIKSRLSQ